MPKVALIKSILILTALIAITGCRIGPGGAAPGLIVSDVTYPNELNPSMSHRIVFDREDIEILKPVTAESVSKWFMFVWATGDSGYGKLMEKVRAEGGDGVMNVTIDTKMKSILIFYVGVHTQLTGLAYRYKRESDYEKKTEVPES